MSNILLSPKIKKEDNTSQENQEKLTGLPYFIEIQRAINKKIKIPCSNEIIAKRVLASYSNNKSNNKTCPEQSEGSYSVIRSFASSSG